MHEIFMRFGDALFNVTLQTIAVVFCASPPMTHGLLHLIDGKLHEAGGHSSSPPYPGR